MMSPIGRYIWLNEAILVLPNEEHRYTRDKRVWIWKTGDFNYSSTQPDTNTHT